MAYVIDPGGRQYAAPAKPKAPAPSYTPHALPAAQADPWMYGVPGLVQSKPVGVPVAQADPWMYPVPGLVTLPGGGTTTASPSSAPVTPPAPAGPPKYNLSLDPGVILAQSQAKAAREAALRAHQHALTQVSDRLYGRGLRGGEVGYQTGEENYGYGNTVTGINNTALQAYITAWQYAQQHPELFAGVTGLPTALGG